MRTMPEINQVDLAFVVDTTGSMAGLIAAAQRQMISMLEALASAAAISLRLGVVEYRDHPPQDSMITRAYSFTDDLRRARTTIDALAAAGGGDGPEAVLDGVAAACRELEWRRHARRIAVLVGDAPPHGVGAAGDSFAQGCPCGESIESVSALAERARVALYALGLTGTVREPFGRLARATGGAYLEAGQHGQAIDQLRGMLQVEFGSLDTDQRVLEAWRADSDRPTADLAAALGLTRGAVVESLSRLGRRDLI